MRYRAFPGRGPEVNAQYERAGKWLLATVFRDDGARDWCQKNQVPVRRATGEGIGTAGAFLVPLELERAILDIREMYGAFRRRARIYPMATDSTVFPRRTGGTTASFMAENTSAASTAFTMDSVNATAKKIGALITVSSDLENDSLVSIVDYVANELAWAFSSKEDDCAFNGDGTSTYGGMRGIATIVLDGSHNKAKVSAASGHGTYSALDTTDIGNLMAGVRASAIPNAAWFVSQTGFALTFCRLAGSAGGAYLYTAEVDGICTPFYLGFPVILTQKLPLTNGSQTGNVMMVFGDMYAAGVLGERRGITVARSDHRYLDTDQIAILGTERFDAIIHDVGDNTNYGSLAALVGG